MNILKISILAAVLFVISLTANAQFTGKVSGNILKNEKAAEGATISLLRGKDSGIAKLSVANKEGNFLFDKVAPGKYLVSVTAVGHQKNYSKVFSVDAEHQEIQLPTINLIASQKTLSDVTVTAKRALVEQRIDRTIVNVDASITNIGTSALEVLEKSPGVSVDRDGNISLKGKEGVLIMVDGRPTQLGGADLANLLRNMSPINLTKLKL